MNELDKKIAELKGFAVERKTIYGNEANAILFFLRKDGTGFKCSEDTPLWSTSDAKALELVDELGMEFKIEGKQGLWSAVFDIYGQHHQETGNTRPEAICRAYIVAMKYMKGKK